MTHICAGCAKWADGSLMPWRNVEFGKLYTAADGVRLPDRRNSVPIRPPESVLAYLQHTF